MEKFLEKLDEYNIFNYLLPGIVFVYMLKYYVGIDIIEERIVEMFFIYYFIGSIINRVGSIIIEDILIKCKFIKYAPYEDYIKANEKDKKISQLLTVNNMYRTICSSFLLLIIIKIIKELFNRWNIPIYIVKTILIIGIIMLYLFSYKKQTKYIEKRIEINK